MPNRPVQHARAVRRNETIPRGDLGPVDTAEIPANALCTRWAELREYAL